MAKRAGPMDIYPQLPQTNCGDCGELSCMAFATKLAEYTIGLGGRDTLIGDYHKMYERAKEAFSAGKNLPISWMGVRE